MPEYLNGGIFYFNDVIRPKLHPACMTLLWYLIGSSYLDSGLPFLLKNDSHCVLLLALVMVFCHFLFHWRVRKLITVGKIFIFHQQTQNLWLADGLGLFMIFILKK